MNPLPLTSPTVGPVIPIFRRSRALLLLVVLAVAALTGGAALWGEHPQQPQPPQPRQVLIDVADGPGGQQRAQLDATLYAAPDSPAPAVVIAHGIGGDKNSSAAQARELARRGFAVLTYSARGFGASSGRIGLNSPDYEVADARQVLDWLARQPEVQRDRDGDPRVGVTGDSYGGALSLLLAGSDARVDAIAPVMTYNDLGRALLPNNASDAPPAAGSPAAAPDAASPGARGAAAAPEAALPGEPAHPGEAPASPVPGEAPGGAQPGQAPAVTGRPGEVPAAPGRPEEGAAPGPRPGEAPHPTAPPPPPGASELGVFKKGWAGQLFATGAVPPSGQAAVDPSDGAPATCGKFEARICAAYAELARTGRASPPTRELLASLSPSSVAGNIRIPTLLVQGEQDTLFGLDQAEANARQIAGAGGVVKTVWFAGGHDGDPPSPRVRARIGDWFAFHLHLPGPQPDPGTGFEYDIAGTPGRDGEVPVRTVRAPAYPGIGGAQRTPRYSLPLHGPAVDVVNPPGGEPASTSSLPALRRDVPQPPPQDLPGQAAAFRTDPVPTRTVISGMPRTRLSVRSVPGQPSTGEAVLFAKLYDLDPEGHRSLLGGAAAPLHLSGLAPDRPAEVDVALPGVVHSLEPGHRLELAVTTTDQAYATMTEPAVHRVGLAGARAVSVPSVKGDAAAAGTVPVVPLAGIAGVAVVALLLVGIARLRRRRVLEPDPELAEVPLAIEDLRKRFSRRAVAVRGVSMQVRRGEIVGLLGPNGAGKTTTLRTLLGLLRPDSGAVRVFGHRVRPGAPVLSRIGSLVESPGFLPHLSGLDNLKYHWAATGRPMLQARFDEVLHMTGLDEHADRRAGTLSQGLRQRLAIAQAMLGLPDLLVLDEPLNGLDPPQIHRLREILRRYAASGRSVLISSHLLSEVEQTCTHVVVMHEGEVVTSGPVDEIVSIDGAATFRVDDPERAADALRRLEGLGEVEVDGELVHAELAGHTRAVAVNALVAAGVGINQVGPRRRLEDAFLDLVGEERR